VRSGVGCVIPFGAMGCASSSTARECELDGVQECEGGRQLDAIDHGQKQTQKQNQRQTPTQHGQTKQQGKYGVDGAAAAISSSSSSSATIVLPVCHTDVVFGICALSLPRDQQRSGDDDADDDDSIGCHFASGSEDRSIALINASSGNVNESSRRRVRRILQAHPRTVTCMASAGGSVFSGSRDKEMRQWRSDIIYAVDDENAAVQPVATYTGHTLPISSISARCSPADSPAHDSVSGSTVTGQCIDLVSGSRDYSLRFWDVSTSSCIGMSSITQNVVTCVRWIPSRPHVCVQSSEDLTLRVWDARLRQVVQSYNDGPSFALCCDASADGSTIITAHNGFEGEGCELKVWDARMAGRKLAEVQAAFQAVRAACFIKVGRRKGNGSNASSTSSSSSSPLLAATASKDGTLKLWDINALTHEYQSQGKIESDSALLAALNLAQYESTHSLTSSCSEDGPGIPLLAAGHMNGRISVWEINDATDDHPQHAFRLRCDAPGEAE